MPIAIRCPSCNKEYKVDDKLAGKKVKCRDCGTPIAVEAGESLGESIAAPEETPAAAKTAVVKRCPSCRSPLAASATYCASCGWSSTPLAGGNDESIPVQDSPVKRKRKWVREAGNPTLNSVDSILNIIVWWSFLASLAVWVFHIAKSPWGISFQYLLPLILTVVSLAGLSALMLLAIRTAANFLQFPPRDDTFNRVLLAMFLPLAASLIAGWPGLDSSLCSLIVTLAWIAAPALFIYFFRAEPLEWAATLGAGITALFIGYLAVSLLAGPIGGITTLYKKMLPDGPWTMLATAELPLPAASTKPDALVAGGPATNPSTAPAARWGATTNPNDLTPEVQVDNTPKPAPVIVPATPAPAPEEFSFLTNVIADKPEFQNVTAIRTGLGNWAVLAKTSDDGIVTLERWSLDPLTRKGNASIVESPVRPATYAISPKGDMLLACIHLPREQTQLLTFDGKPPVTLPPREVTAVPPSAFGFLDYSQPRAAVKYGNVVQLWNAVTCRPAGLIQLPPGLFPESNAFVTSPNWHYMAAVSNEVNGVQITIFDPNNATGTILRKIQATNAPIDKLIGVAFSPDSKQIALCVVMQEVTTVLPFTVATGAPLFTPILSTHAPAAAGEKTTTPGFMWLQNGLAWLVAGNDLYDTTGKKLGSLHLSNVINAQLVGPDSLLMLQQTPSGQNRAILAAFDDAKIHETINKLKE